MSKFTFKTRKAEKINDRTGYDYEVLIDGRVVTNGWSAGSKTEALHQARVDAEAYGFIDE